MNRQQLAGSDHCKDLKSAIEAHCSTGDQRKLPSGTGRHEILDKTMRKFHGQNRRTVPNDLTYHSFGTQVSEDRAARRFCLAIVRIPLSKSTSVAGITLGIAADHRWFRKIPTLRAPEPPKTQDRKPFRRLHLPPELPTRIIRLLCRPTTDSHADLLSK